MPSIKRKSRDLRTEVLESASSAQRPASLNKRPRLSTAETENHASRETSFFSEANFPSTQFQATGNILQSYEEARDNVSDVSSDEDAECMDKATQNFTRRALVEVENQAQENGILQTVTLRDFMCHRMLQVDLGPLINFIIGHNGSGKSAVLTAITICLGGKATSTNRGQSLKSFVREGAETAILSVKIKNKGGDNAYKRDVYGDAIVVERKFNIHGFSGFAVKSKDGRIISKKKSEVDSINDHFALQLDNPVNVLTQDQARQFLNNSSHAEKYRFFMKGVQLEQLDQDYCILGESLDATERELEIVKEDCKTLKEAHENAKKKHERSRRQGSLREHIKVYSRQIAWVQVEAQERELEEWEQAVERKKESVERREQNFQNRAAQFDQTHEVSQEAQRDLDQVREAKQPLEEAHREAKEQFDKVREEISACQTTQREIKQNLDSERKLVQEAQHAVDEEYQRLNDRSDGREADKRNEIREAEDTLSDVQNEAQHHDGAYHQLEEDRKEAEETMNQAGSQERRKQATMKDAQRQLQELQKDNRDKFAPFDSSLRNVLRAIDQEKNFQTKPVGPLAWHVRNKKPQWQNMIERTFGGILNNFIVTSRHDQVLLSEILRRCKCSYHILVADPRFRLPRLNEPDPRFNTILRTLEIDNDMVRDQLIITNAIEQTILVDSQAEAIKLTEHQMPEHCKAIMCPHPRERGRGFRYMQGRGGSQKMEPVDPWKGLPRMKTDDRAAVRSQQETVQGLKEELLEAEQNKRDAMDRVKQTLQALQAHKRRTKELRIERQRAEDGVEELRAELEAMQPQDGKLDGLKTQLEDYKQQVQNLEQQLEEAKEERENIAHQNRDNKKTLDELTAQISVKDAEISEAEKKVLKYKERRETALRQKNEADSAREDAASEVTHAERSRDDQAARVEDFVEKARMICERIPVDPSEDYDSLDRKLNRWHEELNRVQNEMGGDEAKILDEYVKAREALKTAERRFEYTKAVLDNLKLSLLDRQTTWRHFRNHITCNARAIFTSLMRDRGFEGKMLIDHKSMQLQLQVNPDTKRARGDEARQTKTLSGGEKSFSTVCMLLALWEAMGSPIRCLDEFDVFMDNVNRDVSMRMMIKSARQAVGRQFILITPQAMGGVEYGPDVKIIRMSDPERGQTTLNIPGS